MEAAGNACPGSRLVDRQSQSMTVAARLAEMQRLNALPRNSGTMLVHGRESRLCHATPCVAKSKGWIGTSPMRGTVVRSARPENCSGVATAPMSAYGFFGIF